MYNEDVYYYVKNLTPEQFKSHIISGEFAKNVLEKSKWKYNIKTLLKNLVRQNMLRQVGGTCFFIIKI